MKKLLLLILLIANSLWASPSTGLMTLAFQSKVVVRTGKVTLGDLFLKEKTSPEIIQRFSGVSLEGVQGGILQASHVLDILSRQGLDLETVALEPPSKIEIVFDKNEKEEIKPEEDKKEVEKPQVAQQTDTPKPLMKKGDVVTLVLSNASFQIRTIGRVKEVQDNGNRVLVENSDSKKEIWGKAINDSEVQVAF